MFENGKIEELEALFENSNLKIKGSVWRFNFEKIKKNKSFVWKFEYEKNVWKLKIEIKIELQAAGQSTAHLPKISALSLTKKLLAEKVLNTWDTKLLLYY